MPTNPTTESIQTLEQELRYQLAELERQAVAFNEAIGLLRASLTIASQTEDRQRLQAQELHALQADAPEAMRLPLQLAVQCATEGWQHQLLHTHTMRSLYHQILETKRRFLHHWYELLQQRARALPQDRRTILTSLLESSFQGALSVGIEHMEERNRKELQQFLTTTPHHPSPESTTAPSHTSYETLLASLIATLQPQTHDET